MCLLKKPTHDDIIKAKEVIFNSLLEDIRGSKCCVIKVRQYMFGNKDVEFY